MASKQTLPVEIHDHFRKATILDGYAMEHASETLKYALQVGEELLAAKALIPHGGWVDACKRLFEPSLRKAEGYMRLSRNMNALPKSQKAAILFLENTLEGAAKAAKKAAKPDPPKPDPDEPIDAEFEPADEPEEDAEEAPLPDDPEEESIQDIVANHNKAIESFCRSVRKLANQRPDVAWLDHMGRWEGYFRKITQGLETLRCAKAVVCPSCDGEGCKECEDHGFLPKMDAEGISA